MPFFKKRKSQDKQSNPVANGTITQPEKPLVVPPPLQNFVPPPDVVAEALLAKTNQRSSSNIPDLILWAREYFCTFMKGEGFMETFEIWEDIRKLLEEEEKTDDDYSKRVFAMKSRVEAFSIKADDYLENLKKEGEEDLKDCLHFLTQAHNNFYETLQETCLPRYQESKYHVKCQMDLFTNGSMISLYDILLNQNALFYFMEFVEQEGKREVLEFWLGATNFKEQFCNTFPEKESTIDFKTGVSDAMVLYEKYISLQAPHPLGLRDQIRSETEAKICSQEEISHCFNSAIIEAFAFLHVTCLEGFLKSSLFLSFLSDLIGSLNSSKSQQALDSSSLGSSGSVKSYPVSSSSSLTSPTALRERGKLSLGRVNALGKFEADVDLDVFKKESSITKTVKRFVNFEDKEKAKEELAWQVAAMIVNEVTSVTMGPVESKLILE